MLKHEPMSNTQWSWNIGLLNKTNSVTCTANWHRCLSCVCVYCSGYPNEKAVHVVLGTVRHWLEDLKKRDKVVLRSPYCCDVVLTVVLNRDIVCSTVLK